MVSFVLALAVLNLAVGYAAAAALVEPPFWAGLAARLRRRPRAGTTSETGAEGAEGSKLASAGGRLSSLTSAEFRGSAMISAISALPADWLDQLAAEGIVAQSYVEGVAHVLRLEVGRYRDRLVAAEERARSLGTAKDADGLRTLADDLRYLNQDWLDKETAAADLLAQRAGTLGDHENAAAALEQTLIDQASQIRASCVALESLDAAAEAENHGKLLLEQATSLLVHAHSLRDRMLDLLATLLRVGNALDSYGPNVTLDTLTGLPNRIGLESLLAGWWRDDPPRTRLLSAILIDIDRCGRVNQRVGTQVADRAIAALGRVLGEAVDATRGFERLVRMAGGSFMMLQGDAGPHQALSTAERLRQAIEATTFDDRGFEFDLTMSCGVIEVRPDESSLDVVRRAQETLEFAKKAGRNRCALDKGDGPLMLDPPQFAVKARVILLSDVTPSLALSDAAAVTLPVVTAASNQH